MKKLSTSDVIAHLQKGAILSRIYEVYSYWELKTIDGLNITNIKKGACEIVVKNNSKNLVIVNQDNNGYSLTLNK
jgi:hypothetical protein